MKTNSSIFNNYRQAQEYERKRIANDLHDTSLQTLAYLINKLEVVSLYIDKDIEIAKLELADSTKVLQSVVDEIRDTIYNIRPMSFDDLSLKEAIEQHIINIDNKSSIKYSYDISDIQLNDEFNRLELFRCVQECINNCEKHSDAKSVNIIITQDKNINISISDDGIGFDSDSIISLNNPHFGLKIIKDRIEMMGGIFKLVSINGSGTSINISVPVN